MTLNAPSIGTPRSSGFTLIELMITVSVLAILLAIAAPSFTSFLASNRITSQTNELIGVMHLARAEAVRRGQTVTLLSGNGNADFAGAGWRVFVDLNGDGDLDTDAPADTPLRETGALPGRTTIQRVQRNAGDTGYEVVASTSNPEFLSFNPRGAASTGAMSYFKICDAGNPGVAGRIVRIAPAGLVSVFSTTEPCAS
jgi:type IV fimbrial biogenesis protein FimT